MRNNDEVMVIGEALADIVISNADGASHEVPGGSPANVALGLGRLGRSVLLETCLGYDERGQRVKRYLEESGVRLTRGSTIGEKTSTALARIDSDGQALYEFDFYWDLTRGVDIPSSVGIVHTGSIGAVWPTSADTVFNAVKSARDQALVTYDPNMRPSILGSAMTVLPRVEAIVGLSDIVKVSLEDLQWLAVDGSVENLIQSWLSAGPSLVILTKGAGGAEAFTSSGLRIFVPAPDVEVVDTVGAGDSFMAGVIDALCEFGVYGSDSRETLKNIDETLLEAILKRGSAVSRITLSRRGADLPFREDVGVIGG